MWTRSCVHAHATTQAKNVFGGYVKNTRRFVSAKNAVTNHFDIWRTSRFATSSSSVLRNQPYCYSVNSHRFVHTQTSSSSPPQDTPQKSSGRGFLYVLAIASAAAVGIYFYSGEKDTMPKEVKGTAITGNVYRSGSGAEDCGGAAIDNSNDPNAIFHPTGQFLRPQVINAILHSAAHERLIQRGHVDSYHVAQYTANERIEDSYAIENMLKNGNGILAGVFDGHSGSSASVFARRELLGYLQTYFSKGFTKKLLDSLPFQDADNHFLSYALKDGRTEDGLTGACVLVAHIDDRTVRTASAGDCRAIVGRKEAGGWKAIEVSIEHQIDTNPNERERLLSNHIDEHDVIHRHRVKGRLQPTRGLGDGVYKRIEYFYAKKQLANAASKWTPPYTTATPDIVTHELADNDLFMVLSSDGLYMDLSPQQIAETVGEWIDSSKPEDRNAGAALIRKSLMVAQENVIGRPSRQPKNLSWVMNKPYGNERRRLHDDMTAIVFFFDHSNRFPEESTANFELSVPPTLERALGDHLAPNAPTPKQIPFVRSKM